MLKVKFKFGPSEYVRTDLGELGVLTAVSLECDEKLYFVHTLTGGQWYADWRLTATDDRPEGSLAR